MRIPFIVFGMAAALTFAADFSGTPVITDQGAQVRIQFSVTDTCDVAVFVENGQGRVVRHLAAGLLGRKAPAPLQPSSLSQVLVWDKKDDNGNAVSGTFKVKIGLKLKADFDRYYGVDLDYEMYKTGGPVKSIAVDAAGNLVVKLNGGRGNPRLLKYTHDGHYLQTLVPYPAWHSEAQLRGFQRVALPGGGHMPLVYESRHNTVVPELFNGGDANSNMGGMVVTNDGRIVLSNAVNSGSYYLRSADLRRFLIINLDGTCPRDSIFGPVMYPKSANGELYLALSPDNVTLYASGLRYQAGTSTSPYTEYHGIFRGAVESRTQMQLFIGDTGTAGNDNTHLNLPRGIAVDAAGRIYVADQGNNRVVVYDAAGAYLSQKAVRAPEKIQIHPVTGHVYMVSLGTVNFSINKYAPYPAMDSLYAFVSTWDADDKPQFCLNGRVSPAKLYYNNIARGNEKVYVVEDNGTAFVASSLILNEGKAGVLSRGSGYDMHESPGRITIDTGETIIMAGSKANWVKINIATGEIKTSTVKANDMAFGKDGYLYCYGGKSFSTYQDSLMRRFQVDWNSEAQAAFSGGAMEFRTIKNSFMGPNTLCGGLYIDRAGKMYVSSYSPNQSLCVYNPDGTLLRRDLVLAEGRSIFGGVQMDQKGKIFTMIHVKPKGMIYPDMSIFTGPYFPNPLTSGASWAFGPYHNHYAWNMGSVLRFDTSGGSLVKQTTTLTAMRAMPDENLSADTIPKIQTNGLYASWVWNVTGVEKQYYGISPSASVSGGHDKCLCISGRLGIDGFGRVYAPDALRFNVVMLDNNLNELSRVGAYGNTDMGPGTAHPETPIPFAHPQIVAAINNHVYVSDLGNHRIMRLNLTYHMLFNGDSVVSVAEKKAVLPAPILSVFPTPFRPDATLSLKLPSTAAVRITIHAADGSLIRTLQAGTRLRAGNHAVRWSGRDSHGTRVGTGVYLIKATVNGKVMTHRLTLVR